MRNHQAKWTWIVFCKIVRNGEPVRVFYVICFNCDVVGDWWWCALCIHIYLFIYCITLLLNNTIWCQCVMTLLLLVRVFAHPLSHSIFALDSFRCLSVFIHWNIYIAFSCRFSFHRWTLFHWCGGVVIVIMPLHTNYPPEPFNRWNGGFCRFLFVCFLSIQMDKIQFSWHQHDGTQNCVLYFL